MRFNFNTISGWILPSTIVLGILFSFRNLTQTFFQQDEWQYFGSSIYAILSQNPVANILLPLQGKITHFFPLATTTFLLEYVVFKMNFASYALFNLIIHVANALLLYVLAKTILRSKILAWGVAVLFSVNSLAYQPITWVAAGIGTMPGTFFLLLFLYYLVRFCQTKQVRYGLAGFVSIVVSILFKETSIFLFPFIPMLWVYMKRIHRKKFVIHNVWIVFFIVLGFLYVALRIFFLLTPIRSAQPEVGDLAVASIGTYAYRFITVSFKAFPQSIFPFSVLRFVSNSLVYLGYPQFIAPDGVANPYIVESLLFDSVCFGVSALLLFISIVVYRRLKKEKLLLAHIFIASLLFIATSALPYIFIPGRAGFFSIFEPRDLYVVSIGTSAWISLTIYAFGKKFIFLSVIVLLFVFHSFFIQEDIRKLSKVGSTRKNFLTTIETAYIKLPQNVIFFTESDRSYYGLPANKKILPIQSGFGRMLMVWYQDKERFPVCLYEDAFLHGIDEQGYRSCGGRGVGYFWNYYDLVKEIKRKKFSPNEVIAYSWNGTTKRFLNVTPDIKARLWVDTK